MNAHAKAAHTARPAEAKTSTAPAAREATPQLGNMALQEYLRSGAVRPQLTVGSPDDPAETEADRMAQQATAPCACGGGCGSCNGGGKTTLRRQINAAVPAPAGNAAMARAAAFGSSTGRPLPLALRAQFEPRFGADFSSVRIHDGPAAAATAAKISANAYTAGSDIGFAKGQFAPDTARGQKLLAHELAHTMQNDGAIIRRDGPPGPSPAPAPAPAPTPAPDPAAPPAPPGAPPPQGAGAPSASSVAYDGPALSPVMPGMLLSPDAKAVHNLLGGMIIEHDVPAMRGWVDGLDSWILQEEQFLHAEDERASAPPGDVSGAPAPDLQTRRDQLPIRTEIAATFKQEREGWNTRITQVESDFDNKLIADVSQLLDQNREQVLNEAARYGIRVDGPQPPSLPGFKLPFTMPAEHQKSGAQDAAKDLIVLWEKRDETKKTMEALLTPPWGLMDIERNFMEKRQALVAEYPILGAYADNLEKLREFANQTDPTESLRIQINTTLDNIAWARAGIADHLLPAMKRDIGLRNGAKRALQIEPNSAEDHVIEQDAAAAAVLEAEEQRLKSVLSAALLIASLVPGVAPVAMAAGAVMGAVDLYGNFEEYMWEKAAAGSAFDRAAAISQSDPSLFQLGVEIAAGVAAGVVAGAVLEKAAELFKALAPLVREAAAARFAVTATEGIGAEGATTEAMARLKAAAGPELGERLELAVDRGEFGGPPGTGEAPAAPGAGEMQEAPAAKAGVHQEVGGLPDAFGGDSHELQIGERGLERCSMHCLIFGESLASRAGNIDRAPGASEATRQKALTLRGEAQGISAEAVKIEELPQPQRTAREKQVLARAREMELEMTALEHDVLGFSSALPPKYGAWRDPVTGGPSIPGNSEWFPPPGSRVYAVTKGKGVPFHNGFPNFSEWALPGSDVSLPSMTGVGKGDFTVADTIAAARTGMTPKQFQEWRLDKGYTWHHRENSLSMQLVPTPLHASVPHLGGAWVARGVSL